MRDPQAQRGYRAAAPATSNQTPTQDSQLKGPPPNLYRVDADQLSTGATAGNLGPMLAGIPPATRQRIGMPAGAPSVEEMI